VWLPRHRLATYWFFLVRYMAIVATATYATFYFGDFLPEVCVISRNGWEIYFSTDVCTNDLIFPCLLTPCSAVPKLREQ
jgi:hypothetical protein